MTSGAAAPKELQEQATAPEHRLPERLAGPGQLTSSFAIVVPVPEARHLFTRYAVAVGATLVSLAVTLPLAPFLQRVIFVLFWPAVIGAAWFGGIGPAVLASALSVLFVDYYLIGVPGQLSVSSPDDLIPFGVFLFASTAVAMLTNATRSARRTAAEAAARNAELAHEIELQAIELEQQLEESQVLSEELEQSTEELAERTAAAESAELYTKGILEGITDPFVVHDAEWRFRYVNEAAATVFRESPRASNEPPLGQVLWDVYPDIVGTPFEREMRRAATERRPVTFEAFYPARGEWSRLSCYPLPDGGLATQWTDVTARKRAEETEHYLNRASEVLASSLDYETTLAQLARVIVPQLADWCAVHIVENGEARQLAVAHVDPKKVEFARELNRRYPPRADAPTGVPNVLRTRRPEIYAEVTDDMLVAGAVDADHLRISRELGLESALIVPMLSGDNVIGALTLVSAESGRRYSERDLPLATELARRAAIAVEHARLHQQAVEARLVAERAAWSADRLYSLTARLTAAVTPQAVAEAMLAEASDAFGAERGTVSLIEDDGDTTRSVAQIGYAPEVIGRWRSYSLRATVSATAEAVTTGRGVFIESLADARERFPSAAPFLENVGTETAAVLPIVTDGRVRGVITLAWTTVHVIPPDERDFMERFAAQCGQALARALAFEAERMARERTERLQRLTAALADATTERDVARILVANLYAVLQPLAAAVFRVEPNDGDRPNLVMVSDSGVPESSRSRFARFALDGDAPIAELLRKQEAVFLPDAAAFRARFPHWPKEDGRSPGEEAWIGVPLIASTGTPLGVFALGFPTVRRFDADLRRYVESMSDQATQAFERVRLLETEHAAREAAEEANRAKTQFLATMSHELRTPLNAISGYAELLRLGLRGPTTPEQQEDLGRIMRSQRHLLSVINDILNFARLEAGHVEYRVAEVPVSELLGDLESLIRPQLVAKQLAFSCAPVPDDVIVRADAEKVQQVLLNLLANAVKFTAAGGQVRVECEYDESRVSVRVTDTGIGIPMDRRGAIFEPFVQLHRTLAQPAEGTGLGLAISRDLARGMGGELTVESEPGRGSTFTLVLDRVR